MNQSYIGIDIDKFSNQEALFVKALRRDPLQLVICTEVKKDIGVKYASIAFSSGHDVLLISHESKAPKDTYWLDEKN